jgi:diguanylate cyclase (GGDEF)-like protein/PAS domain S-box-containing protein
MEDCESIHKLIRFHDIEVPPKIGIPIPFNISIIPLQSKSNLLLGFLIIGEDIRMTKWLQDEIVKHKLTNQKLRNSEELSRNILEITPVSIILTGKYSNQIKYVNTRAEELFNADRSELIGSVPFGYFMNPEDRNLFIESIKNDKKVNQKEVVFKKRDGSQLPGLVTMLPSIYQGEEVALFCVIDMTEQKRVEETLKQNNENINKLNKELIIMNNVLINKSTKDGLTNLFNHQYINEVLELKVQEAAETKENLCVMMLDIDNFKHVNDRFGHQIGDKVLVTVADLLMKNTRDSDFIGRYGGEEFIVVLPNINRNESIMIAERIRISIQDYDFGVKDLKVTISIGVVQYVDETPNALVNRADMLLYQAKHNGKNRVEAPNENKEIQIKDKKPF